eukprot:COSAG02_NODE_632_length_19286_cov_1518.762235_11_plen_200_part_00
MKFSPQVPPRSWCNRASQHTRNQRPCWAQCLRIAVFPIIPEGRSALEMPCSPIETRSLWGSTSICANCLYTPYTRELRHLFQCCPVRLYQVTHVLTQVSSLSDMATALPTSIFNHTKRTNQWTVYSRAPSTRTGTPCSASQNWATGNTHAGTELRCEITPIANEPGPPWSLTVVVTASMTASEDLNSVGTKSTWSQPKG